MIRFVLSTVFRKQVQVIGYGWRDGCVQSYTYLVQCDGESSHEVQARWISAVHRANCSVGIIWTRSAAAGNQSALKSRKMCSVLSWAFSNHSFLMSGSPESELNSVSCLVQDCAATEFGRTVQAWLKCCSCTAFGCLPSGCMSSVA